MSTTITETASRHTQPPTRLLADYELHHSGVDTSASKNDSRNQDSSNASYWDVPHRRVPTYRPVDTNRDQSQIRVYNNPIERAFIFTMFTGVFINASVAKAWRASFGRLNENIFRYRIGGEL